MSSSFKFTVVTPVTMVRVLLTTPCRLGSDWKATIYFFSVRVTLIWLSDPGPESS